LNRILKYALFAAITLVAATQLFNWWMVDDQPACTEERLASALPVDSTLTKVEAGWFPVQHCLVEGYVTTRDPGPNRVNFILQLPEKQAWNGRYYFIGLGGGAGRTPKLSEAPFGNPVVSGFAVAGSDTGHQSFLNNPLDWSFLSDEAKTIDHVHRGAHVSAVATQALTQAYFGVDRMYRYHSGCSGGGRMGVMAALHHPGDYDGYLIGAPGITTGNILNFIWISQQMEKLPGGKFEAIKLQALERSILEQCDASDGVADQMVWDIRRCHYDPGVMQCGVETAEEVCLDIAEVRAIRAILAGPQSLKGQVYPGLSPANPTGWQFFLNSMADIIADSFSKAYFDQEYDFRTEFDFSRSEDLEAWHAAVEETGFGARASADYSGVREAGGKAIFWHGVSDPAISVLDQIAYYDEIRRAAGGQAPLDEFSRMYLVPGLYHCFGGPGPVDAPDRLLQTLIDWVENDKPPASIVARRGDTSRVFEGRGLYKYLPDPAAYIDAPPKGTPPREFLICPYPQIAVYSATEDAASAINDAANWRCEAASPGDQLESGR
jgi:Tannase and feruloyl esterase